MEQHFYEPAHGHGLRHDPLNSIVAPRPIGWISTVSPTGVRNLAPYSFFNLFSYRPPLLGFASGGRKDSVRNAEATGEFVWNLATRPLAEAMNATSTARDVDEFAAAALEAAPSRFVGAPRVAASPVQFECKVTEVIHLRNRDGGDTDQWMVFGEAIGIHIAHDLIVDGVYRTLLAEPISRGGGPIDYFGISEEVRFGLPRPE